MSLPKIWARAASKSQEAGHNIEDSNSKNAINEPDSTSSTDSDNNEAFEEVIEIDENENPTFATRMLSLSKELALFCMVMIILEALTKNPPKIGKPPAAYPFFPKDSIVTDWYRGQVSKAIEQAKSSDIAFVMFYAPWDAESQAAREEFEAAAKYFQDYVTFTAVNCWQPDSECRNQYSKVYRWPVLIAYPSHGRGVQYNGPISSMHLIKFLQKVCNPFLRYNEQNLKESESAYAVVTLNTLPGSRDFAVLYTTTLKYIEKDPLQTITFFIEPRQVSEPSLYLHLWNETLIYPVADNEWRSDEILQWMFKNFHQVTSWVAPSGTKSLVLSGSLQPGPALIMFTPKNPLHTSTDYYSMLQEIGYEYYNCDENLFANLHAVNVNLKRTSNLLRHKIMKQKCALVQERKIISHLSPKKWTNISNRPISKDCEFLEDENHPCSNLISEKCTEYSPTLSDKPIWDMGFEKFYETSMLTGENDPRSAKNLLKLLTRYKCRQFQKAEEYHPAIFENKIIDKKVNVTGLACKTNSSLTLIAMDSLLYYHFAKKIGINLFKNEEKSALVVLSEETESYHIMKGPINSVSVREFIQNFTKNQLPRSLDSYSLIRENKTQVLNKKHNKNRKTISIGELNTDTFLPTVLQKNKAVLVFYYSKQCAFCSSISFMLLTIVRKFSCVENLSFFRIDGDINNLPWEYTMESYPTILFFPAYDKSESRVFPHDIPITVPNLKGFILGNLESNMRLDAMWTLCNQTKFEEERISCLSSVQAETLTVINTTLQDWRRSNKRQKQILLHKLRHLKQLHLLVAHYPQKYSLIRNYFKKLNSNNHRTSDYYHLAAKERLKDEL